MNRYFTFDRINNERILSFYSRKPLDLESCRFIRANRSILAVRRWKQTEERN